MASILQTGRVVFKNDIAMTIIRSTILLGIFAYLIFKLSSIGWKNILQSLPSSPAFYLLSILFVLLPILAERIAFRLATKSKRPPKFKTFIRKHVINKAVMNYAGEGYFFRALVKSGGLNLHSAAVIVKNLALTRTFAANLWIIILVLVGVILGNFDIFNKVAQISPALVIAVSAISVGVCIGSTIFFRKLTRLKIDVAGKIVATYLTRSFLAGCILVAQWNLVLPGKTIEIWIPFLIVFFIAKKSPVGGDLVFVSVALSLPGFVDESASIAAMFLMTAAVLQVIYALAFAITSEFSDHQNEVR